MIPSEIWQLIFKINERKSRRIRYDNARNKITIVVSELTMLWNNEWLHTLYMDFTYPHWSSHETTTYIYAKIAQYEVDKALRA